MTADKAISELQSRVNGTFCVKGVDDCKDDIKLGIEALKKIKQLRYGYGVGDYRLPSETEG